MPTVRRRITNITYERYIFNTRVQQANETIDQYVTELKNKRICHDNYSTMPDTAFPSSTAIQYRLPWC